MYKEFIRLTKSFGEKSQPALLLYSMCRMQFFINHYNNSRKKQEKDFVCKHLRKTASFSKISVHPVVLRSVDAPIIFINPVQSLQISDKWFYLQLSIKEVKEQQQQPCTATREGSSRPHTKISCWCWLGEK